MSFVSWLSKISFFQTSTFCIDLQQLSKKYEFVMFSCVENYNLGVVFTISSQMSSHSL